MGSNTREMDGSIAKPPSSVPSLVSRLDRLDSMMRHLEGKKGSSRWSEDSEAEVINSELVPLDLAVKEAQSKGSILDRIAVMEDRLIQLVLDNEYEAASTSRSHSNMELTSPDISSSPRKGFCHSFSRFRSSSHGNKEASQSQSQVCMDKYELEEQQQKPRDDTEASVGKKSRNKKKDERASHKVKKIIPSSFLHLRLLGC